MITSAGIGSGLDVENIISSLLAVEGQPIIQLQQRKSAIDVKISAFGQIKSQLDAFKTVANTLTEPTTFQGVKSSSSDTDVLTVSGSNISALGRYDINVTALAQAQVLDSNAYTDIDTVVGEGQLAISSGSTILNLTINSENNTLAGIRDAINNAEGNTFVTASTINTDGGSRLILTATEAGSDNVFEINVSSDSDGNNTDSNGLSALVYQSSGVQNMNQTQAAQNSALTVNGYAVTDQGNKVSDVIQGVTLDLSKTGSSVVNIERDSAQIETQLKSLVTAYNATMTQNNQLRASSLSGESYMLSVERAMRSVFNQEFFNADSELRYVFDIGLSFAKDGTLSLDSSKLNNLLNTDLSAVQNFLSDTDGGFATQLNDVLDGFTKSGGTLQARTDGLNEQIDRIDDDILNVNFRLTKTETRLRAQFTSLDTLLGSALQTSTFLSNQLGSFNFSNNSSSNN